MIRRREFTLGAAAWAAGNWFGAGGPALAEGAFRRDLADRFARIEEASGGRLGIGLLDTGSGAHAAHRGDERFPLCSTFKVLAAGAVLARVDRGEDGLDRRHRYEPREVVPYSPVSGPRAGGEAMTIAELCEAAVTLSDNTAANLLLRTMGGPAGLTGHIRGFGDATTRLDRTEPDLNEAAPGDARDTTTPLAMAETLRRLVLADALSPASRALLTAWLVGCRTGEARLRAGLPQDWRIGDKTGSGENDTANDVAVIWPPRRPPLVLTVYLTGARTSSEARSATIASVARAVAASA
ncbi:class A beta-lactamase [Methylobacterium bullatum]|uniref:Beta-lactamase n=1 Tax=Methylobacterium bullatum TaxID=570505 RepID=A0AAV4Z699_9HYPH|nr:class A beta-lactamase [Methylobacterium bullatum]MBD8904156.1 class A beta-lactamase [Methylobacterium bullatum]GJD39115.1 Beta-lactamase CTX-M-97 [Methylobacterium bullatum]